MVGKMLRLPPSPASSPSSASPTALSYVHRGGDGDVASMPTREWYALPMDTPPAPDEIHEMREELHRLIDRLPAEALVALWRLGWRQIINRRAGESS